MHPIEHLRYVARARGADPAHLAREAATALGSLRADPARNLLIFSGTGVETAAAKDIVRDLEIVFAQDTTNPLAGVVRFVPIDRLNAVLVISPQPAYLEQAQSWVERFDRGEGDASPRIYVYHVENGRAADLAQVLDQLFTGASGGGGGGPLPGGVAPGFQPVELQQEYNEPPPAAEPPPPAEGGEAPAEGTQQLPALSTVPMQHRRLSWCPTHRAVALNASRHSRPGTLTNA